MRTINYLYSLVINFYFISFFYLSMTSIFDYIFFFYLYVTLILILFSSTSLSILFSFLCLCDFNWFYFLLLSPCDFNFDFIFIFYLSCDISSIDSTLCFSLFSSFLEFFFWELSQISFLESYVVRVYQYFYSHFWLVCFSFYLCWCCFYSIYWICIRIKIVFLLFGFV